MSSFYGQVQGTAQTLATRRGSKDIKVSAQSWNGSVIIRMYYDDAGELSVELSVAEGSSFYGYTKFSGTLNELVEKLK